MSPPPPKCRIQGFPGGLRLRRCAGRSSFGYRYLDLDVIYDPAEAPDAPPVAELRLKYPENDKTYLKVGYIEVSAEARKQKLGTALYERALREVCSMGRTLSSDAMRSEFAESFWRKQERKGRARCVPGEGEYWDGPRAELEEALDTGKISAADYRRATEGVPEPSRNQAGERVWPCLRYEIKDPCGTESLAAAMPPKVRRRPSPRR